MYSGELSNRAIKEITRSFLPRAVLLLLTSKKLRGQTLDHAGKFSDFTLQVCDVRVIVVVRVVDLHEAADSGITIGSNRRRNRGR